jgi:hypothetical protein
MMRNVFVVAFLAVLASGCAASRNYQPDIDSLNAKVASLQDQLQAKNRETGALMDQVRALQTQLEVARGEKQNCDRRLDESLGKLSR